MRHAGRHSPNRALMPIIDFTRRKLGDVVLCLNSRPERVTANEMYRKGMRMLSWELCLVFYIFEKI